jgi:hypothetical protein
MDSIAYEVYDVNDRLVETVYSKKDAEVLIASIIGGYVVTRTW